MSLFTKEKDKEFYVGLSKMCKTFGQELREYIIINHPFGGKTDVDLMVLPYLLPGIRRFIDSGLKES